MRRHKRGCLATDCYHRVSGVQRAPRAAPPRRRRRHRARPHRTRARVVPAMSGRWSHRASSPGLCKGGRAVERTGCGGGRTMRALRSQRQGRGRCPPPRRRLQGSASRRPRPARLRCNRRGASGATSAQEVYHPCLRRGGAAPPGAAGSTGRSPQLMSRVWEGAAPTCVATPRFRRRGRGRCRRRAPARRT